MVQEPQTQEEKERQIEQAWQQYRQDQETLSFDKAWEEAQKQRKQNH